MRIDTSTLERLEWGHVRTMIGERVRTPMGAEHAAALLPAPGAAAVGRRQARAAEMRRVHASFGRLPLAEVKHPKPVLDALQVRRKSLPGDAIYETVRLLIVAREVASALRELEPASFEALGAEWARFPDVEGAIAPIDGNISPSGELEDSASPELARIRAETRHLSERLESTLSKLMKAEWTGPVLRDRYVTVRNNRYVVPVRTDTPRRFHGIVHGTSGSEKTLFVEPMETVDINNQLVRLKDEEAQEIERILAAYTEILRAHRAEIDETAAVLGEIDLLEGIAGWADAMDACRPELGEGGGIRLEGARHPVLERSLAKAGPGRGLVPLDVDLARELRVLVISGPNAGGKTVALKTIGLLAIMAHAGLPVPARSARLPLFSQLLTDIGDDQSIEGGLSTFSSHIQNLARMLRDAEAPALVLLDEIGTGTDPAEGAALGTAVLDRMAELGLHVVATTHHQAIKTWAYRRDTVLNAACDFDESTLRPTYRLVPGVAGASIGLTMAEQLGLDAAVVQAARDRLDPAGAEATRALDGLRVLASEIETQREELVARRRELEVEAERRRDRDEARENKRQEQWQRRLDEVLGEFRKEAARMIAKIGDQRERRQLEKERARRERELKERFADELRAGAEVEPAPEGWTPAVGERVLVASLSKEGVVGQIRGDRAEVELGRARFTVAAADLRPLAGAPSAKPAPELPRRRGHRGEGVEADVEDRVVSPELHLLGMRVDEALSALDKYLDDASLAELDEVRIVHGIGTGRLKTAVREYVTGHGAVVSFKEADPRQGGAGATVLKLGGDA